jgi:phage-related protein
MTSMTFKGVTSAAMGVIVLDYPPITKPAARIKTETIPGRSGDLTLQSDPAYDAYDKKLRCRLLSSAVLENVSAWLNGSGLLVIGNEPTYAYSARVEDKIDFEKVMPGRDARVFEVTFTVQPEKRLATPEADIVMTAGGTIANPGTLLSRPRILVNATGDVTLMIGQYITDLEGLTDPIILDSEIGMATNAAGTLNASALVSGEWPMLGPGNNAISWAGAVTSLTITPRWRWL